MSGISFQARHSPEGLYITSGDLPGFRLFVEHAESHDLGTLITGAMNEFLPLYETAMARQRVGQMFLQKIETLSGNQATNDFEIRARFQHDPLEKENVAA